MRNLAEAVRGKLKNKARQWSIIPEALYTRWVMERFLSRFAKTPYAEKFALKGGMLFAVWDGNWLRSTGDIDLEGLDPSYSGRMADVVSHVVGISSPQPDGVMYDVNSLRMQRHSRRGLAQDRIIILARLSSAIIRLKVDTGFGHPITPAAEHRNYPSMLEAFEPTKVLCCPREMMLAEKLATIVEFGGDNTRVRDYHDICTLANQCQFDGATLLNAIRTTFSQRDAGALIMRSDGYWEAGLSREFAALKNAKAWSVWIEQQPSAVRKQDFSEVVGRVREFAMPLLSAARSNQPVPKLWYPESGWRAQVTLDC